MDRTKLFHFAFYPFIIQGPSATLFRLLNGRQQVRDKPVRDEQILFADLLHFDKHPTVKWHIKEWEQTTS